MKRQDNGTYRCNHHEIILHTPVRVFCRQIDYNEDWFAVDADPDTLRPEMLYIWLEKRPDPNDPSIIETTQHELAPVHTYSVWAADTFWRAVRELADANNHTDNSAQSDAEADANDSSE